MKPIIHKWTLMELEYRLKCVNELLVENKADFALTQEELERVKFSFEEDCGPFDVYVEDKFQPDEYRLGRLVGRAYHRLKNPRLFLEEEDARRKKLEHVIEHCFAMLTLVSRDPCAEISRALLDQYSSAIDAPSSYNILDERAYQLDRKYKEENAKEKTREQEGSGRVAGLDSYSSKKACLEDNVKGYWNDEPLIRPVQSVEKEGSRGVDSLSDKVQGYDSGDKQSNLPVQASGQEGLAGDVEELADYLDIDDLDGDFEEEKDYWSKGSLPWVYDDASYLSSEGSDDSSSYNPIDESVFMDLNKGYEAPDLSEISEFDITPSFVDPPEPEFDLNKNFKVEFDCPDSFAVEGLDSWRSGYESDFTDSPLELLRQKRKHDAFYSALAIVQGRGEGLRNCIQVLSNLIVSGKDGGLDALYRILDF
ncbi:hypothetical protein D6825_03745 [Candidatus Woesearchaeota archaeon]|nr:MAG: hypothetical protein D6825_03745 [Candidatus Woesearchaeota archaeon]